MDQCRASLKKRDAPTAPNLTLFFGKISLLLVRELHKRTVKKIWTTVLGRDNRRTSITSINSTNSTNTTNMASASKYNPLAITKKRKVSEEVSYSEINKENTVNNENKVKKVKKVPNKKPVECKRLQCIEEDNSKRENFWKNWAREHHQEKLKAKRLARVAQKQARWLALRARLARAAEEKARWQARWEKKLAKALEEEQAKEARVMEKRNEVWKEEQERKMDTREYDSRAERPSSASSSSSSSSANSADSGLSTSGSSEDPMDSDGSISDSSEETEDSIDSHSTTSSEKSSQNKKIRTWWKDEKTGECGVRCCEINNAITRQTCYDCGIFLGDFLYLEEEFDKKQRSTSSSSNNRENTEDPMDNEPSTSNGHENIEEPVDKTSANSVEGNEDPVDNQLSTSSNDLEEVLEVVASLCNQPSTSSTEASQMNEEYLNGVTNVEIDLYETAELFTKAQHQEDNQETSEGLTQQLDFGTFFKN